MDASDPRGTRRQVGIGVRPRQSLASPVVTFGPAKCGRWPGDHAPHVREHADVQFLALATSDDAWFASLDPAESRLLAEAEARRAWELRAAGVIRAMYWRADRRDVVIELEAGDEDAARAALAELPFVQLGRVTFRLIGLRPYDGWDNLAQMSAG